MVGTAAAAHGEICMKASLLHAALEKACSLFDLCVHVDSLFLYLSVSVH